MLEAVDRLTQTGFQRRQLGRAKEQQRQANTTRISPNPSLIASPAESGSKTESFAAIIPK